VYLILFEQALSTYTALEQLAHQSLELTALIAKLPLYATSTPLQNSTLGHTLSEQALRLARALQDQAVEAKIL